MDDLTTVLGINDHESDRHMGGAVASSSKTMSLLISTKNDSAVSTLIQSSTSRGINTEVFLRMTAVTNA